MAEWVRQLPFSIHPLIAEARRRTRRRRVLLMALTLAVTGGFAGALLTVQTPSAVAAPRLTAFFSVKGNAPRGVVVSYADSRSPMRVVEDGGVPLHAYVSRHGISFYEFRARIFEPGGHITCKIRLGSEVVVSHASGTNSLCVVKARVPAGAVSGGEPDRASFDLKPQSKPAVTPAMVTAAHRDEARLLRMFVPPTGAQRLSQAPAPFRHVGRRIFGVTPGAADRFARFSYWKVRSTVSTVTHFELAHHPFQQDGCSDAPSVPLNRLCGVGLATGKGIPANARLQAEFPRVHGLVSNRELRVFILQLSGGWTGVRVAATNHTWIPPHPHHASPPAFRFAQFLRAPGHPVAGQMFSGLELVIADPKALKVRWLRCTAAVGHEVLPAHKRFTMAARAPRGVPLPSSHGPFKEIACSWRIPADAAGKELRLRNYSEHIRYKNRPVDPIAIASIAGTKTRPPSQIGSPEYSWTVRPAQS